MSGARPDAGPNSVATAEVTRRRRGGRQGWFPRRYRSGYGPVAAIVVALAFSGCGPKRPREASVASEAPAPAHTGEQIYQEYCAVCHMPDGGGVPNFQPALRGNAIVAGDPAKLEAVIRAGSAALRDREPSYAAEMPPFGTLNDDEIAAIVAYVRERFATPDSEKTP